MMFSLVKDSPSLNKEMGVTAGHRYEHSILYSGWDFNHNKLGSRKANLSQHL